jgi:hypothetical protein
VCGHSAHKRLVGVALWQTCVSNCAHRGVVMQLSTVPVSECVCARAVVHVHSRCEKGVAAPGAYRMVHCCGVPHSIRMLPDVLAPTPRSGNLARIAQLRNCPTRAQLSKRVGGGSPLVRRLLTPCHAPEGCARTSVIVCISVLYLLCSVARKVLAKLDWTADTSATLKSNENDVVVSALCAQPCGSPALSLCPLPAALPHLPKSSTSGHHHHLLITATNTILLPSHSSMHSMIFEYCHQRHN